MLFNSIDFFLFIPIVIILFWLIGSNKLNSSNYEDWTIGYNSHWTCYGHEKVAEQILNSLLSSESIIINNYTPKI